MDKINSSSNQINKEKKRKNAIKLLDSWMKKLVEKKSINGKK